jgi:hypothetical protein
MNPIYTIMESPYRWRLLAGISFCLGLLGALMMIAYGWSHTLIQIWFWAGTVVALGCLGRGFYEWKQVVDADAETTVDDQPSRGRPPTEVRS